MELASDDPKVTFFSTMEERFTRSMAHESEARARFLDDMRFANADSDNLWQWDTVVANERSIEQRPTLTINKTRQHNLQIINDARQNKPAITIRPTGGDATYEAAVAIGGLCRYIEYKSNAQATYDSATNFMVNGGVGYWRVLTDYCNPRSFDQDIKIKHIPDPLCVFVDPDATEPDKSDMNFAFIFSAKNKKLTKQLYPQYDESMGVQSLGLASMSPFVQQDSVVVTEYYERVWTQDTLYRTAQGAMMLASEAGPEGIVLLDDAEDVVSRQVNVPVVTWYLVVGRSIIDSKVIPGELIPIVQIAAEETLIEGKLDRKSHTRALKDPQRMYNYWSSASVEYGALQTKSPWVAPVEAIEGYEDVWAVANIENKSFLPYRGLDDAGNTIPPPIRVQPPMAAPVCLEGMRISQVEMMLVSGQYDNSMGQQGNERTGKAINARQRAGDNATYHYINALAIGVKYTGKIILGMLPIIYDTKRVVQILAQDGESQALQIDPSQGQAYNETRGEDGKVATRILNPSVGMYEVQADTGPGYATQREEAFNAFALILTQNPALTGIIGDIMLKAGDFPLADEAAARLKRMVPPEALGEGPSAREKELGEQIKSLSGTIQALMDQLILSQAQVLRQGDKTGVEQYKAFTDRVKVILDAKLGEVDLKVAIIKLLGDMMKGPDELSGDKPNNTIEINSSPERPLASNGGMIGQRFMG